MIRDVLKSIAKFKEIPIEELESQICENTKEVFPKIF
jgi:Tat protein secretion system quality control protein TatD with DNase activity